MHPNQLPELSRRTFLCRTLQVLGAAAAMPLASVSLASSHAPQAESFLNGGELATLDALADSLIPSGGAFGPGARDVKLLVHIDDYLHRIDPRVATGFRGALVYIETEAPALAGKSSPFSALDAESRAAVLQAMLDTPGLSRGVFLASKNVCMVNFYTLDQVWQFTGYDGPML